MYTWDLESTRATDISQLYKAEPFRSSFCRFAPVEQTVAEGTNKYGKANSNYPVLETFEEGSVIETKVVMSTWHYVSDVIRLRCHVVAVEG